MPITQRAYEQAQQAGGAEGFDPNAFQGGDAGQQKADDGVVDAEFTEVKDDKNNLSLKRPREGAVFYYYKNNNNIFIYFHKLNGQNSQS